MITWTLCQSVEYEFFCLQATDAATDALVDLYYLSGETCSRSHTWVPLADVGSQEDPEDTDAFWQAVDTGITWIYVQDGPRAAWEATKKAYEGMLSKRELGEYFRTIRTTLPRAQEGTP